MECRDAARKKERAGDAGTMEGRMGCLFCNDDTGCRDVRGQSRAQAIRGWTGPFTDNPPHAKSPAVYNTARILDPIILLIQISYLPVCTIHEFSLQ